MTCLFKSKMWTCPFLISRWYSIALVHTSCWLPGGRVLVCAILWIPAGWTATMLVKPGRPSWPRVYPSETTNYKKIPTKSMQIIEHMYVNMSFTTQYPKKWYFAASLGVLGGTMVTTSFSHQALFQRAEDSGTSLFIRQKLSRCLLGGKDEAQNDLGLTEHHFTIYLQCVHTCFDTNVMFVCNSCSQHFKHMIGSGTNVY